MTDRQLMEAFEAGTLAPADFGHGTHLRLAWLHLRRFPLGEALTRYGGALERLAAKHGSPGKYHATVTWALLLLMHSRLAGGDADLEWEAFVTRNADLLDWKRLLATYYRAETLASDTARRTFVFPDRPGSAAA